MKKKITDKDLERVFTKALDEALARSAPPPPMHWQNLNVGETCFIPVSRDSLPKFRVAVSRWAKVNHQKIALKSTSGGVTAWRIS